jgi:hypothetical protein
MHHEELRKLIRAVPFQPFVIHMPSGQDVPIHHPDFALLSPNGRTLFAYQPNYDFDMINVMLIESVSVKEPLESGPSGSNAVGA